MHPRPSHTTGRSPIRECRTQLTTLGIGKSKQHSNFPNSVKWRMPTPKWSRCSLVSIRKKKPLRVILLNIRGYLFPFFFYWSILVHFFHSPQSPLLLHFLFLNSFNHQFYSMYLFVCFVQHCCSNGIQSARSREICQIRPNSSEEIEGGKRQSSRND